MLWVVQKECSDKIQKNFESLQLVVQSECPVIHVERFAPCGQALAAIGTLQILSNSLKTRKRLLKT